MITNIKKLIHSNSTTTCRESRVANDIDNNIDSYKIIFHSGNKLFIKKNRPIKEIPVNILMMYDDFNKNKNINFNEKEIDLRTRNKKKHHMKKILLPKINKTMTINCFSKKHQGYVLPVFKPISQIIGDKITALDKLFNKATSDSISKMKCEERYRLPTNNKNNTITTTNKKNKSVEMRQSKTYKVYKHHLNEVHSKLRRIKND